MKVAWLSLENSRINTPKLNISIIYMAVACKGILKIQVLRQCKNKKNIHKIFSKLK